MAVEGGGEITVPVVHSAALAVKPLLAVYTGAASGPGAVAERAETLLPDFPEIVGVDAALRKSVAVDVRTAAYPPVPQN